jgi:hypothetical protein
VVEASKGRVLGRRQVTLHGDLTQTPHEERDAPLQCARDFFGRRTRVGAGRRSRRNISLA